MKHSETTIAGRVVLYLGSPWLYRWTKCAREALGSRDVQALRTRLPALLKASDERVLEALEPTCEANGVFWLVDAERQEPELEGSAEAHRTASQAPEVSEPTEALLMAPQVLAASQPAQAPLISVQAPEVGTSAPEPAGARGPGALCANRPGCLTGLRQVPPGGPPPAPAPAAPGSTPSTGALRRQPAEEDSWPWPAHGPAPALT
jgi:hypothetical protein